MSPRPTCLWRREGMRVVMMLVALMATSWSFPAPPTPARLLLHHILSRPLSFRPLFTWYSSHAGRWRDGEVRVWASSSAEGEEGDPPAQLEADRIMKELQEQAPSSPSPSVELGPKYMPSTEETDPIVAALKKVLQVEQVTGVELLDSRWNGNEVFRYETDRGPYFVKLNRVEDPSVFLTEAVGLTAIAKTQTIACPKPLHLGRLPKVGETGPGAFMVLDYIKLLPFGIMRSDMQRLLGEQLASLHTSHAHDDLHKGRFGFAVSNFLALTPLNNTWSDTWTDFFTRRLSSQLTSLYEDKAYGRRALNETDTELRDLGNKVLSRLPGLFDGITVSPSLIHGDLWVGNTGATAQGPVIFDPACFFGHHEMELAIMEMFGGFRDDFWKAYHETIPKAEGFDRRRKLYQLYYYLNQLNLFGSSDVKTKCTQLAIDLIGD